MKFFRIIKRKKLSGIDKLRGFAAARWPRELGSFHGLEHWDRVARFGKMLWVEGADMDVIKPLLIFMTVKGSKMAMITITALGHRCSST